MRFLFCVLFVSTVGCGQKTPTNLSVAEKVASIDAGRIDTARANKVSGSLSRLATRYKLNEVAVANKACVAQDVLNRNNIQMSLEQVLVALDLSTVGFGDSISLDETVAAFVTLRIANEKH